jgi:hypothetical protein
MDGVIIQRRTEEMEKVKEIIPSKTIDLLRIIKEEYVDFQKSTDSKEKMNHIMEVQFGTFLYFLTRYDYGNYLKLKNDITEEE